MSRATIYHNPRCTKSRQTLQLLEDHGIEATVIEYLKTPPDEQTLIELLRKLRLKPEDLIRKKEYKDLGLEETEDSAELIRRMAAHPQIIERPIVVVGRKAALGRPPENILDIL